MTRRDVRRRLRRLGDPSNWQTSTTDESPATPAGSAQTTTRPARHKRGAIVIAAVGTLVLVSSIFILTHAPIPTPADPIGSAAPTVPWISDSPRPTPTPTPEAAAACRATDFSISAHLEGTVMGYTQSLVTLTQRSSRPCALNDKLGLDSTRNGTRFSATHLDVVVIGKTYSLAQTAAGGYVMPPQTRLVLRITGTPASKGGPVGAYDRPAWLRINGTATRLRGYLPANVIDNNDLTLTADAPIDPQDSGTGPYSALHATIDQPLHPTAGTTLEYTVTMQNTTNQPFAFDTACPAYEQAASIFPTTPGKYGPQTHQRHVLNCQGITIPAEGSVTFAMRLPIPDATGPTRLGWALDNGPSDATSTTITTTK